MATKKTIFVAFAIEDERQRDFLRACLETHLSIMKRFSSMLAMAI